MSKVQKRESSQPAFWGFGIFIRKSCALTCWWNWPQMSSHLTHKIWWNRPPWQRMTTTWCDECQSKQETKLIIFEDEEEKFVFFFCFRSKLLSLLVLTKTAELFFQSMIIRRGLKLILIECDGLWRIREKNQMTRLMLRCRQLMTSHADG